MSWVNLAGAEVARLNTHFVAVLKLLLLLEYLFLRR